MEFLKDLPAWMNLIAEFLVALSIVATLVVDLIPGDKDDKAVGKVVAMIRKVLEWFPKMGLNPRTKAMEKALKELKK